MKDYTINGWNLRFDNGTSRIIRDARGIKEENALDGLTDWQNMAPWILMGGLNRSHEKLGHPERYDVKLAIEMIEDLSPAETVELINAYVRAMTVQIDGDQPTEKEGEPEKKS